MMLVLLMLKATRGDALSCVCVVADRADVEYDLSADPPDRVFPVPVPAPAPVNDGDPRRHRAQTVRVFVNMMSCSLL